MEAQKWKAPIVALVIGLAVGVTFGSLLPIYWSKEQCILAKIGSANTQYAVTLVKLSCEAVTR